MKRKIEISIVVILALFGAAVIINALFPFFFTSGNISLAEKKFNSQEWIQGDKLVRGSMVADLASSKLLIDKSRQEVIQLLGKSESDDTLTVLYWVDLGHRWGSDPWLYYFKVEIDSTTQRVTDSYYTD